MKNIFKLFYTISIHSRWYKYWSKLYRKISKNQRVANKEVGENYSNLYKRLTDAEFVSALRNVQEKLDFFEWKKDGPAQLWDAVTSWKWGEYKFRNKSQEGPFDCDDFANYACHLLMNFGILRTCLLSTFYVKNGDTLPSGHTVCLVPRGDQYYHLGNWGLEGPFNTEDEVVQSVLDGINGDFICYATHTAENLTLLNFSTKMPSKLPKKNGGIRAFF